MSTGITRSQIEQSLRRLLSNLDGIEAAYGFGSFFRSNHFSDIDIVVVFSELCLDRVAVFNKLLNLTSGLSKTLEVKFDITPLTRSEFEQKPLRESNSLFPLFPLFVRGGTEA